MMGDVDAAQAGGQASRPRDAAISGHLTSTGHSYTLYNGLDIQRPHGQSVVVLGKSCFVLVCVRGSGIRSWRNFDKPPLQCDP